MSFKELIKRCLGRGKACKKKYINVKISVKLGGYIQVSGKIKSTQKSLLKIRLKKKTSLKKKEGND